MRTAKALSVFVSNFISYVSFSSRIDKKTRLIRRRTLDNCIKKYFLFFTLAFPARLNRETVADHLYLVEDMVVSSIR